jgi:hypothetical protein
MYKICAVECTVPVNARGIGQGLLLIAYYCTVYCKGVLAEFHLVTGPVTCGENRATKNAVFRNLFRTTSQRRPP